MSKKKTIDNSVQKPTIDDSTLADAEWDKGWLHNKDLGIELEINNYLRLSNHGLMKN